MFAVRKRSIRVPKRRPTGATHATHDAFDDGVVDWLKDARRAAWAALYPPEKRPPTNKMGNVQTVCLAVTALYAANVHFYAQEGDGRWTVSEAIYFLTVTFSTVGFGDYVPAKNQRFACMLTALFGVMVLFMVMIEVQRHVVVEDLVVSKAQAALLEHGMGHATLEAQHRHILGGAAGQHLAAHHPFLAAAAHGARRSLEAAEAKLRFARRSFVGLRAAAWQRWNFVPAHACASHRLRISRRTRALGANAVRLMGYASAMGAAYAWLEGWTFVDGLYYAVISASSVGYGDLAPETPAGRWLAVATLPACFLYMNHNVNEVAQNLAERR